MSAVGLNSEHTLNYNSEQSNKEGNDPSDQSKSINNGHSSNAAESKKSKLCDIFGTVVPHHFRNMVVQGSFHQGSALFSDQSRGRQCVPNALISCVLRHSSSKSIIAWSCTDIDDILRKGDILYKYTRLYCDSVYLAPGDVPNHLCIEGQRLLVSIDASYSGDIGTTFEGCENFFTLESALSLCFSDSSQHGILICNFVALAVHYCEPYFHIFDSHSRSSSGITCNDGKASLFTFDTFPKLLAMLRNIFHVKDSCQFDLHKIKIQTVTLKRFRAGDSEKTFCLSSYATNRPCLTCQPGKSRQTRSKVQSSMIAHFHATVSHGPDFVCACCMQTWFREGVKLVSNISEKNSEQIRTFGRLSLNDYVCILCFNYLHSHRIPPLSTLNGLKFPPKPPELNLSSLEERLVSARIPFMQLREKPRGKQLSITGNVVNVPSDVSSTISKLPRLPSDNETIALKFKRNLSFKHHVAFEMVRPNKVIAAAKWLVKNSTLFQSEGIQFNDEWALSTQPFVSDDSESDSDDCNAHTDKSCRIEEDGINLWFEEPNVDDRPSGNMDTVLHCIDFREFNEVLSVAPGENHIPLGIYKDKDAESLAFPTIYCGYARPDNKTLSTPVHYSSLCKWELRNVDRRCALCVPNIFFKMKKLQIKQLQDKVSLAVRKCKFNGKKYTAAEMLDKNVTETITRLNEGYNILRTLRGSPPYWEKCKKDIFAMVRQLGLPTWFCSFSAAETKWKPLLRTLGKLVNKKDYTDEEIDNLSWEEKSNLIKSDPVTCARYFDYRFQRFMSEVLLHKSHPIGEVLDFFYRIEFQQRGSPHVHMLLWIKDAPNMETQSNAEIATFLDEYLTCSLNSSDAYLVNYQTHRHARSCMKKNKPVCRFNFPLPPMPYTVILSPIEEPNLLKDAQQNYMKISNHINSVDMKNTCSSFDEFLAELDMDLDTYMLALRAPLKQSKVYLRRSPNEIRINQYNPILLNSWLANLDIQFVLDAYACVAYIVSYVSKGQRGMSNLLHKACDEARRSDSDIRQQVRRIGNQFLSHVEVGAQEAAYLVLQMPLRKTSRSVIFINTTPPEERVVFIKPKHVLQEMNENSIDIESNNTVTLYQQRPKVLENMCLADFISKFSIRYKKKEVVHSDNSEELPEINYEEDTSDIVPDESNTYDFDHRYVFRNGTEIVKKRKQSVLRWVHFDIEVDPEKYYRELLMLFLHWRKENNLMQTYSSYMECFHRNKIEIVKKQSEYEKGFLSLENMESLQSTEEVNFDFLASENEHLEEIDRNDTDTLSSLYGCFDPGKDAPSYDVGIDLGISRKYIAHEELTQWGQLADEEYRQMVRQLNFQQKDFFLHVLHHFKTSDSPMYTFLSGGAGVGKSIVTKALYQSLVKYFSHKLHESPDNLHVLLCAPTGKAAHNIKGSTVHSSFCLPVCQGFQFKPLDMQQLNTMRTKYMHLKVLCIDEISMVGRAMFNFVNLRLQEIKGCKKTFGGVSVIAVGDLFQLKPVMDAWIFSQPSTDYGPIAANLWKDNFSLYELTEIMRQKDDKDFAYLLNRLREGQQTEEDMQALQCRIREKSQSLENILHLFTTRREVADYNEEMFRKANCTCKVSIKAIDWVVGTNEESMKEKVLSRIPKDSSKTMGLSFELRLIIDFPTEITTNVNVKDGITNGSSCIVRKFDYRVANSDRVSIVWVEFEDKDTGKALRTEYSHLFQTGIDKCWTPITEITRLFTIKMNNLFQVKRRQFPLQLASAKTIHKAQGSTLSSAVVHFGSRKNDHIHYVGLSRVTCIENLSILHLNDSKISVSSVVLEEMERLRSSGLIDMSLESFLSYPLSVTKFVFFNIRSLHCHYVDLQKDYNLLQSTVLCLSETRLKTSDSSENFALDGYTLYRFDEELTGQGSNYQRPVHGLAFYIKNSVFLKNVTKITEANMQFFAADVCCTHSWVTLLMTYIPPKTSYTKAIQVLQSVLAQIRHSLPLIVAGDMNFDANISSNFQDSMLKTFGVEYLKTSVTTDYNSTLDHIYTNLHLDEIHKWGTLESYYSDHKPLFLAIK